MVEIEARPRSPRQSRAATTSSSRPAIFRSQWTATLSSGDSVNASRTASSVSGSRRAASPQSWATRSGGAPSGAGPATARRQSPSANSERGRSTSSSIISAPAATAASKLSRVFPGRIASAPLWPIRFKARHPIGTPGVPVRSLDSKERDRREWNEIGSASLFDHPHRTARDGSHRCECRGRHVQGHPTRRPPAGQVPAGQLLRARGRPRRESTPRIGRRRPPGRARGLQALAPEHRRFRRGPEQARGSRHPRPG